MTLHDEDLGGTPSMFIAHSSLLLPTGNSLEAACS